MMPNTVGIIDGTEIFIERPSNLSTQKSSWSDYKSHSTVKYLVSIDPFTGVFTYISAGFSGNASDRFIVENSTFWTIYCQANAYWQTGDSQYVIC
jgi:hypothetical protein